MNRAYIITILLLVIALIFAIQNTATLTIKFLTWSFGGSQALIIAIILFLGFFSGWFLGLSRAWKKNAEIKSLNKKITELKASTPSSSK